MRNKIFIPVLIVITFWTCKLEKVDFINFDLPFTDATNGVGYSPKNDLIQLETEDFFFIGTSKDTSLLIANISEEGELLNSNAIYKGIQGYAISPIEAADNESFIMVGKSEEDFVMMRLNNMGGLESLDSFRQAINTQIGLVESVTGNDVVAEDTENFVIVGSVRQSIGGKRLLFLKVNQFGEINILRTLNENAEACTIKRDMESNYVVSGYRDDRLALWKLDKNGVLIWQKSIEGTFRDSTADLAINHLGHYMLIGSDQDGRGVFINEFDRDGELVWEKLLTPGGVGNRGCQITTTRDTAYLYGIATTDGIIIGKIARDGTSLWERNFPGEANEKLNALFQTIDYGIVAMSLVETADGYAYRIIKTDEDGDLR